MKINIVIYWVLNGFSFPAKVGSLLEYSHYFTSHVLEFSVKDVILVNYGEFVHI